ncbi:MAG: polysaccharide biosynthesis tyrosine autokinase [Cyclobacteriaceae bacterium]|nr:polysaccharide biosynthesis tyrosine autokinase [Cyclobacteriaceae bacterium]UYN87497.1 MAG: polysaccharide biosynthesis tyrosine autokinase [Cyclobacteriaceae bacterium]
MQQFENNNIASDTIDFNKLKIIVRQHWLGIVLIFLLTNLTAYLIVRYTKDLYESESEIKLDIKQDASELGISDFIPERQKINMISGEIETIQSKLFLSQVIDSLKLHVGYFSIGQFLNTELYTSSPIAVHYKLSNPLYYNVPIAIEPQADNGYELNLGKSGKTATGKFSDTLQLEGLKLFIEKKPGIEFYPENSYSFIIYSRDVLLDFISKNLTVEPLKLEANTIRVSFKDNNPHKARDLVNGIDSLYLAFSHEQKNRANKQKIDWLSNELNAIEKQMESYETYFENFTLANKTNDLESDLKKTIESIHKIDSQRFEVNKRIGELNQLMEALTNREFFIEVTQRTIFPEYLNKNLEKLQELYFEMDRMKLSYNENTFAFKQKQNEIETLRNKAFSQLTDLKTSLLKKQQELSQAKSKLENDFASMPDKNTQFTKKQRFYKLYEEFYLTLMQSKSQFEIAQAGSTPDFKILSTANLPTNPISPNRPLIFGIGFMAGFVLNIFFVGLLYLANNKIISLYEIERLQVPLLGAIPTMRKSNGTGLYIQDHPKSMVSEAMRTLRTNLDFFNIHSTKKVIAVSSTVSGEGKSFIALNLGGVMALSRKRVLLLDLDMRKPKTNEFFKDVDKSKGISTILIRKNTWEECIVNSSVSNFDFIPSGPHPPNPSELLLNGEFSQLLTELQKHYDYIIMDTPPVGIVTDGIMAMKHADITLYIFRANYSKKDFIDNLNRIIRVNKFQNITSILNAVPSTSETAYGYGYYEEQKTNWVTSILKRGA